MDEIERAKSCRIPIILSVEDRTIENGGIVKRCFLRGLLVLGIFILGVSAQAAANDPTESLKLSVDFGKTASSSNLSVPIQILLFFSVLSLAPAILIMTTCFVRIVIVLSFLRSGLSLQQPANQVILSLALFLTAYIMTPTWQGIQKDALQPWRESKISAEQALDRGGNHLKSFMLKYVRERDLQLFVEMSSKDLKVEKPEELPLGIVTPAFMLSELRTGFQMGLLVLLPFLVIDLVVSAILMTLGMMMLPPTIVALPLKVMVFVLVDGWTQVVRSLVTSFG
jgi:flagellar biosynthetic protein FliP